MAGPKSTRTRFVGIIPSTIHAQFPAKVYSAYSNMCPYVAALENVAQMAGL